MALGISRSYLGSVSGHNLLVSRVASSSSSTFRAHAFPARGYAATATTPLKKKATATQKAPKNPSTKPSTKQAAAPAANPTEKATKTVDEENAKQMEEIDRIMAFQHLMPTVDPWGQPILETLDVTKPRPLSLRHLRQPRDFLERFKEIFGNAMKNSTSTTLLLSQNALPGQVIQNLSLWRQIVLFFDAFRTRSVKENNLLAPLRKIALDSYIELNNALASRNVKDVNRLTTSAYQEHAHSLLKASGKSKNKITMMWTLHKHFSPVQVVSIRATEGFLSSNSPRMGNKLMTHALIKFDTEQSLEMYDERGNPLHAPLHPNAKHDLTSKNWRVPAQPRRVTEYLVIEKKGWSPTPWQFREQIW